MTHAFSGLVFAAAAGAASFWGVLTHPVTPHATSTPPFVATTTRPAFATSSMPMHPPFMRASTTMPGDGRWDTASSSLEHMPRPIPPFMDHRASSTASTTRPHPMPYASTTPGMRASSTPHLPPQHIEADASASTSAPSAGFWQRLFRFF